MADIDLERRFLAACAIAREAGQIMRAAFAGRSPTARPRFKSRQDFFTETDAEIERLVRRRIGDAFPADSVLGEEGGGEVSGDLWVVDPIDGTANFARGLPDFCISLAFLRDQRIEIGIIYAPVVGELFVARRGQGAAVDGRRMRVSGIGDMRQATVEIGWSPRLPPEPYVDLVHQAKSAGANVRRGGSGALALAYVADGRIDAYCELHINAWDALAGILLVEEAGGVVNDFLAGDGLRRGNPVLGCTPELQPVLSGFMGLEEEG